uniref:Protein kinase domain-containing protein n=1 Tax=Lepisosteus oculatus TaxID=7918 RepID=W5M231_LEPOC
RNNKLWICMEFCGGGSLQDIYHVTGPLKEKQIAYVCRETLQTPHTMSLLQALERQRQGANILLTDRGDVKLDTAHTRTHTHTHSAPVNPALMSGGFLCPDILVLERNTLAGHVVLSGSCATLGLYCNDQFVLSFACCRYRGDPSLNWLINISASVYTDTRDQHTRMTSDFHTFLKLALTKNPRKRPTAEKLLQHPFMTQLLTRTQVIELLDTASNPDLSAGLHMDDSDLDTCDAFPDKIMSLGKHMSVARTPSEDQFNQVKFCPPLRKETDPYPDLGSCDDWGIMGVEHSTPSLLECVEEALMERSLTIKRAPSAGQTSDEETEKFGTVKRAGGVSPSSTSAAASQPAPG